MGQHMNRIGTKYAKTAGEYITESAQYKAKRCQGALYGAVVLKLRETVL